MNIMTNANRPVARCEYKLMLRTSKFEEMKKGIKDFLGIIKSQTEKLNLKEGKGGREQVYFEKKDMDDDKVEKKRKVWYLDTPNFELKKNKFLLRIRKERDDDYVTDLKCRNSDRYLSASYDLSPSTKEKEEKSKAEFEFEEDIIPRVDSTSSESLDFASKFSHSVSFHTKKELKLNTLRDLLSILPGLDALTIDPDNRLQKVNNFEAKEISIKLGVIKFWTRTLLLMIYLSVFGICLTEEKRKFLRLLNSLLIIIQKEVNQVNSSKRNMHLEEFPLCLVRKTNDFYLALLKEEEFVDLKTTKTKTDFAYTCKLLL
jgi:hypothetical protein